RADLLSAYHRRRAHRAARERRRTAHAARRSGRSGPATPLRARSRVRDRGGSGRRHRWEVAGRRGDRYRGAARVTEAIEIKVAAASRSYSVWVGPGLFERAAELIPIPERAEVAALVTDSAV